MAGEKELGGRLSCLRGECHLLAAWRQSLLTMTHYQQRKLVWLDSLQGLAEVHCLFGINQVNPGGASSQPFKDPGRSPIGINKELRVRPDVCSSQPVLLLFDTLDCLFCPRIPEHGRLALAAPPHHETWPGH